MNSNSKYKRQKSTRKILNTDSKYFFYYISIFSLSKSAKISVKQTPPSLTKTLRKMKLFQKHALSFTNLQRGIVRSRRCTVKSKMTFAFLRFNQTRHNFGLTLGILVVIFHYKKNKNRWIIIVYF